MKHGEIKIHYNQDPILGIRDVYHDIYIVNVDGIPINYIREKKIVNYDAEGNITNTINQGLLAHVIVNETISMTDTSVIQRTYGGSDGVVTWTQPLTEMTQE